jgi:hypothetical protein
MESLHGVLHGGLWIRFRGLPEFVLGPLQEVGLTQIPGDHDSFIFIFYFFQRDMFQDKIQNRQTPPSNSLELIEF